MTPDIDLAAVFAALGSELRLKILEILATDQMGVTAVGVAVGLSQPTVSRQLSILRRAGLVDFDKIGQFNHFRALPLAAEITGAVRTAIAEDAKNRRSRGKK